MNMPNRFYINICKIFQEIYKNHFVWDSANTVNVGTRTNEMLCTFTLKYLDKDNERKPFSYYDAVVSDAVYTIYKTGANKFSLTDLLRVMAQDNKVRLTSAKGSAQTREMRLIDALNRLKNTYITIDYAEEATMRGLDNTSHRNTPEAISGYLLPIATNTTNKTFWFIENRELPLYQYAEAIHQIISIPKEMLAPKELVGKTVTDAQMRTHLLKELNFSNTDEVVMLKRILLQRIEILGNTQNRYQNRKIAYYGIKTHEGILPLMGIHKENFAQDVKFESDRGKVRFESTGWKNKVNNIHKKVCAILDAYKASGYIYDYKELREEGRGRVRGVEILGQIQKPMLDE